MLFKKRNRGYYEHLKGLYEESDEALKERKRKEEEQLKKLELYGLSAKPPEPEKFKPKYFDMPKSIACNFNPNNFAIDYWRNIEKEKFDDQAYGLIEDKFMGDAAYISADYIKDAIYYIIKTYWLRPKVAKKYKKEIEWANYFISEDLPRVLNNQHMYVDHLNKEIYAADINTIYEEMERRFRYNPILIPKDRNVIDDTYEHKAFYNKCIFKDYVNLQKYNGYDPYYFDYIKFGYSIETAFMLLKDAGRYGYDPGLQGVYLESDLRAILRYRDTLKITKEEFLALDDLGKSLVMRAAIESDIGLFMFPAPIKIEYEKAKIWLYNEYANTIKKGRRKINEEMYLEEIFETNFGENPMISDLIHPIFYYDENNHFKELPGYFFQDKEGNIDKRSFTTLAEMNYETANTMVFVPKPNYEDIKEPGVSKKIGTHICEMEKDKPVNTGKGFSIKDFFNYERLYEDLMYYYNDKFRKEKGTNYKGIKCPSVKMTKEDGYKETDNQYGKVLDLDLRL